MRAARAEAGREALIASGRAVRFGRGDRLLVTGAPSSCVLLIDTGLVKVVLVSRSGAATVTGLFGPGDLLGEMGVVENRPRSADVVALREGQAVHISARTFLRLRNENADVAELLELTWGMRQRAADDRQLAHTQDVATRVGVLLLRWSRDFGTRDGNGLVLRGVRQRDLAQAVCASEKTVEDVLGELRAQGLLATRRLRFEIPCPERLAAALGDGESTR